MATLPVIEALQLTKEYHGTPAVKNVTWSLQPGEVHALLGENGAGKSTFTKMFAGVTAPTSGTLRVSGRAVSFSGPKEAFEAGIAMVFQETNLVPSMTVAQNLFLGEEKTFNLLGPLYIRSQQVLQSLNFNVDPWAVVSTLGAAKKQMVEIARAVLKDVKVIIFDEPTASLDPAATKVIEDVVRTVSEGGIKVVMSTHDIAEARRLAGDIIMLHRGRVVETGAAMSFFNTPKTDEAKKFLAGELLI